MVIIELKNVTARAMANFFEENFGKNEKGIFKFGTWKHSEAQKQLKQ